MRVLVTAGNTRERIDQVRDWGNIFTGNTGYAIARAMTNIAHVDLGRKRRQILCGNLRARSCRAKRPVKTVADAPADPERSGRDWRRTSCNGRFNLHGAPGHEIHRLDSLGWSHWHAADAAAGEGRDAQRMPLRLLVGRQLYRARKACPGHRAAQQGERAGALPAGPGPAGFERLPQGVRVAS